VSEPVKVHEQKVIDAQEAPPTKGTTEQERALNDFSKKNADKSSMRVHVYSPFRDYYDGLAVSLTAENATGPFDIEGERKIRISGGIIHVKANQVIVFLDV